jgi:hypothetical protein
VRLVQCKRRGKLNEQATARLLELANRIHAEAVLAVPGPKNRGVVLERIPVVL